MEHAVPGAYSTKEADAVADAEHALLFDDARAAPETVEALRGAQAYLLFFERVK